MIRDNENNFKVLRTQPTGNLARGAHRVDREYFVLKALSNKSFEAPEPYVLCENSELIGRMFYVMNFEDGDINFDPFYRMKTLKIKKNIQISS